MRDVLDVEMDIKGGPGDYQVYTESPEEYVDPSEFTLPSISPSMPITNITAFPSTGIKFDKHKPRWSLLPMRAVQEVVKVLNYGAKKYADRNWERGINYSRVYDATLRHLTAWWEEEENDRETGLSHLAHAACNILFLLTYRMTWPTRINPETKQLFDDRPGPYKEV